MIRLRALRGVEGWLTWLTLWTVLYACLWPAACRSRKQIPPTVSYRSGFSGIRWGDSPACVDSLVKRDSTWQITSSIEPRADRGSTVVLSRGSRDYYLEFSRMNRFHTFNYIATRDDLDSLMKHLIESYGTPDREQRKEHAFEDRLWYVEDDSVALTIQLLVTEHRYALRITNTLIENRP
jgi:hypothetical protein